jgi:hypothetical protein
VTAVDIMFNDVRAMEIRTGVSVEKVPQLMLVAVQAFAL